MKLFLLLSIMALSQVSFGSVDTLCSDNQQRVQVRLKNVDIRARYLPSKVDVTFEKGTLSKSYMSSLLQGIGEIPQATIPPSGASSMADGPYFISNYDVNLSTGEKELSSIFYLKSADGMVSLTLNKGAALFGKPETTLTCLLSEKIN